MTVLHVFDMDGTLLHGTTASLELARAAGLRDELQALEAEFALGAMSTHSFAVCAAELWSRLRPDLVAEVFAAAPWLSGIAATMADIRARGEFSIVVTMSPSFFADHLTGFGVGRVFASRFPPPPLIGHPEASDILTPEDKVSITDRVLTELGIDRDRCVAYGDSGSDLPLFRVLDKTVGVNAARAVRPVAAAVWDGTDVTGAYTLARSLLEGSRARAADGRTA